MTFLDWLDKHHLHRWDISPKIAFEAGYEEGQQAERERIKEIIREVTGGFGNCDRLMEKIDAGE